MKYYLFILFCLISNLSYSDNLKDREGFYVIDSLKNNDVKIITHTGGFSISVTDSYYCSDSVPRSSAYNDPTRGIISGANLIRFKYKKSGDFNYCTFIKTEKTGKLPYVNLKAKSYQAIQKSIEVRFTATRDNPQPMKHRAFKISNTDVTVYSIGDPKNKSNYFQCAIAKGSNQERRLVELGFSNKKLQPGLVYYMNLKHYDPFSDVLAGMGKCYTGSVTMNSLNFKN